MVFASKLRFLNYCTEKLFILAAQKIPSYQLVLVMRKKLDTDEVIENLVAAMLGEDASEREKYLYRENLRNLVRLAKSEQIMEVKSSVRKLSGVLEMHAARRRAKAILLAQRLPRLLDEVQQQFEFKQ